MLNGLVLFILPLCVVAVAALIVFFWDRTVSPLWVEESSLNTRPSSWAALRSIQHILWILLLISMMAYFFPLLLSFRQKVSGLVRGQERWMLIGLTATFPVTILILLVYGSKKKYMEWIADLDWPHRKDEEVGNGSRPKID